ncbi:MAG: heme ABC exporter ATP-binding protein CcmA [Magnetococcales bacterium]|nr:heme ABC exporter ATP-binding protein CcmA [Magnetococcales bacterium]NGZ26305.1 heme ABC exporter ATP-binding protein CcmA [Magnetococcales bacterium]
MAAARLAVQGVHHRFGRQTVLRGVDFAAQGGECVVLFGSNGAGKSTLLSLLSTRLRLQKGSYHLNDLSVTTHGEEIRGLMLFIGHHTHLYGHLTPLENMTFFADLRGLNHNHQQLVQAIEAVGLSRFVNRPVNGFSAGMRKRLALARMLLAPPALLLLDEPYSALDVQGVAWLNGVLQTYIAGGGLLIMATHDPDRVAALSPRPLLLVDGRFVQEEGGAATC